MGVALSTALQLNACEGPFPGALPKSGLIKTGLGRVQAAKKSGEWRREYEVVGSFGTDHTAHSYFIPLSLGFEVGVRLMWV